MPGPNSGRRRIAVVCLGLAALMTGPAAAGWAGPADEESGGRWLFVGGAQRGPIAIDARRFEADNRRRTATYVDHVVAKQNDTTLTADRLTVAYDEGRQISEVTAEGNVRLVQKGAAGSGSGSSGQPTPDREALCSRVVFQVADDRIVCTGMPATLRQGKDVIRGPKITVQVAEERIVVEGNGTVPRVTSRITPRGEGVDPAARRRGQQPRAGAPGAGDGGSQAGSEPLGHQAGSARPN
jgi:lipopolysaccharide transport protein LptA